MTRLVNMSKEYRQWRKTMKYTLRKREFYNALRKTYKKFTPVFKDAIFL